MTTEPSTSFRSAARCADGVRASGSACCSDPEPSGRACTRRSSTTTADAAVLGTAGLRQIPRASIRATPCWTFGSQWRDRRPPVRQDSAARPGPRVRHQHDRRDVHLAQANGRRQDEPTSSSSRAASRPCQLHRVDQRASCTVVRQPGRRAARGVAARVAARLRPGTEQIRISGPSSPRIHCSPEQRAKRGSLQRGSSPVPVRSRSSAKAWRWGLADVTHHAHPHAVAEGCARSIQGHQVTERVRLSTTSPRMSGRRGPLLRRDRLLLRQTLGRVPFAHRPA